MSVPPLAKDHEVVQAFLLDCLDESLDVGIRVRGAEGGLPDLDLCVSQVLINGLGEF
jgi:hypothetical protein